MANLINADRITVNRGGRVLFADVSLGLAAGSGPDRCDRIGLVGANGAGKTTLLNVLAGVSEPDSGRVTHRNGIRLGVLGQHAALPAGASVGEAILDASFGAEHEWAGDAAVREVLDGLGLHRVGLGSSVDDLSGGERRRVALASTLVRPAEVLILDEPTNHLDVEAVDWLAGYLRRFAGALLVVTHDRWFLDAVCTMTWEVAGETVHAVDGGYSSWVLARAERDRADHATATRRAQLVRKELAWLQRGAPARTSKPRFRVDAANALIADEPPPRQGLSLRTTAAKRLGRLVFELESVGLELGGQRLFSDVTWQVGPGDRIGVVGVNGAGKTTLLRMLTGDLPPTSGTVRVGPTVQAGVLGQEAAERDHRSSALTSTEEFSAVPGGGQRVLQVVEDVARVVSVGDREMTASSLCEMFGFPAERQWTPVGDLSGGERRRLGMLRMLMAGPNVLILDEPTNDLDIDTLTALEDLLDSWPGTLIVVSHDRYLIERVTDTVFAVFGDGALTHLPGGVEEYLQRREPLNRSRPGTEREVPAESVEPQASGQRAETAGESRARRKELAKLERQVMALDKKEAALHEQLADAAADFARVAELDTELKTVIADREKAEHAWLEAAD